MKYRVRGLRAGGAGMMTAAAGNHCRESRPSSLTQRAVTSRPDKFRSGYGLAQVRLMADVCAGPVRCYAAGFRL